MLLLRPTTESLLHMAMLLAVDVTTRREGSCCSDGGNCVNKRVGVELMENEDEDCSLLVITRKDVRVGRSGEFRIDEEGVGKFDEGREGDVGVGRVVDEVGEDDITVVGSSDMD